MLHLNSEMTADDVRERVLDLSARPKLSEEDVAETMLSFLDANPEGTVLLGCLDMTSPLVHRMLSSLVDKFPHAAIFATTTFLPHLHPTLRRRATE
jgi:hypothetical protein